MPVETLLRVDHQVLRVFARDVFVTLGVPTDDASLAAGILVHADSFAEVILHQTGCFLSLGSLCLVGLSGRSVKLSEQLVRLDRDGSTRAVGATHVVRDVFGEADRFDGVAGETACEDEAATKVEEDF